MGTKENKSVPKVIFKVRKDPKKNQEGVRTPSEICKLGNWIEQSTDDFFLKKKVIVFSLPGAFTPTCSSKQLPGFDEKFKARYSQQVRRVRC